MQAPRITFLAEKKLLGHTLTMSLVHNKTFELWSGFMPHLKQINNRVSEDLFSVQVFDAAFNFNPFNPAAEFAKWACAEVSDYPTDLGCFKPLTIAAGKYAVFIHKGPPSLAPQTFGYIFNTWLPRSGYELDHRPHFELLGANYKNNHPESEEEVWIPIKEKVETY